ncbi:putative membrane protein [Luteibacter sp. 3190]|nr:putative membrane protein [Luteibacter sp. 3190]
MLRPTVAGHPRVLWLRPNRALDKRGLRRTIIGLAAIALATAALGAWQGNVFAPVFALLEAFAVGFALGAAWRAGGRGERIAIGPDTLEVRAIPGHRTVRFQTYWVRVGLKQGDGRQRLLLTSHGNELEIGAFLGEEERAEVSRKLMVLLSEAGQSRR